MTGGLRITKGKKPVEKKTFTLLSKCNDCERDVNLSSGQELTEKQRDELHKRMLCGKCLDKKIKANADKRG